MQVKELGIIHVQVCLLLEEYTTHVCMGIIPTCMINMESQTECMFLLPYRMLSFTTNKLR